MILIDISEFAINALLYVLVAHLIIWLFDKIKERINE